MRKPLPETEPVKGFNIKVTYRDEKTGLITHTDPYIMRTIGSSEGTNERRRVWERPAGSGNLFDKSNNPIGRWEYEEKVVKGKKVRVGRYNPDAKHIAFTPPPTRDHILAKKLSEKDVRIQELERELASIAAEKEEKAKTKPSKE